MVVLSDISSPLSLLRYVLEQPQLKNENIRYGEDFVEELAKINDDIHCTKEARSFMGNVNLMREVLLDILDGIDGYTDDYLENERTIARHQPAKGIMSLPFEILSIIMELATEDDEFSSTSSTISRVNRRFREVALQTPCLWNKLWTGDDIEITRSLLQRSRLSQLTVHINECDPVKLNEFLVLIADHHQRVCTLDITELSVLNPFVTMFAGTTWSRLIYLQVRLFPLPLGTGYDANLFNVVSMPNLIRYDGNWFFPSFNASWTHRLIECRLYFQAEVNIISLCTGHFFLPMCRTLELTFLPRKPVIFALPPLPPPFHTPVSLPNLRYLTLTLSEDHHIFIVKNLMQNCLPVYQLRRLDIELHPRLQSHEGIHSLFDYVHFDRLQKFCLRYAKEHGQQLVSYSGLHMPRVEHIEICGITTPLMVRGYLQVESFPILKNVSLEQCDIEEDDVHLLLKSLEEPHATKDFERLHLLDCQLDDGVLRRLEKLMPGKLEWT